MNNHENISEELLARYLAKTATESEIILVQNWLALSPSNARELADYKTIWEKRADLEITLSLKSYLYRAVHNHCLNRFKHATVREAHREYTENFIPQSYESVTEVIHANELEERIEKAVSTLPEQCQKAFRMSRFEELKYQEIADQLGISIKTVENQIGKALKILRSELADYLPSLLILVYLFINS